MVNAFVESRVMQLRPNYPPYALSAVGKRGGRVFSVGEIAHAFTYAPYVEEIQACDIDSDLAMFYSEMKHAIEDMTFEGFRNYVVKKLDSDPWGMINGRDIHAGPSYFVPFMVDEVSYNKVKDNLDKVSIRNLDCLGFFQTRDSKAGMILLNNVPEYVEKWEELFDNLPIEENGVLIFGKGDNEAYLNGNRISPGVIRGCNPTMLGGHIGYVSPGPSWQSTDVVSALKRFGYEPIELPIIKRLEKRESELYSYRTNSVDGIASVILESKIPLNYSRRHNLYTLQYKG